MEEIIAIMLVISIDDNLICDSDITQDSSCEGKEGGAGKVLHMTVMAVRHIWKSSMYIFLLTLFCIIAPWNLDFQSSFNLSFSQNYSVRRLEVRKSTAKCLSTCSVADGLVRYHIGIHIIIYILRNTHQKAMS